jgi:hypothetical protein
MNGPCFQKSIRLFEIQAKKAYPFGILSIPNSEMVSLVALEGNQNQHTYKDTLRVYLLPEIQAAREMGVDMVFMQDNAPCHKTNLVMAFLAQNRIQTLDWPPQIVVARIVVHNLPI